MFNMTEGVVIKNGFAQLNNREGSLLYIKNMTYKNVNERMKQRPREAFLVSF